MSMASFRQSARWRRPLRLAALGLFLAGAVLVSGCSHGPAPAGASRKPEVFVTSPITDQVVDYQDFTGRLEAVDSVEIRAHVTGYVQESPFKEGEFVHKGDLLFQIDPRTYQADLNQAEANLKLAIAERKLQEKTVERARRLVGTGALTNEEFDQALATWEKAGATVDSMTAARDRARLYLDYTHVTAPLSGRVSRRLVDTGNLIVADSTPLTTIVSEEKMYVYFDVDERTFLALEKARVPAPARTAPSPEKDAPRATSAGASWLTALGFPVLMSLAGEEDFTHAGTIDFLDNRVSAGTGTIRMRGVFDNSKGLLKPGLFARIRLPIGGAYQAILIPDEALMSDQGRKFVYVVNADNKVEYRAVKLGQALQGLRVIKEGLTDTDRVVITGMQRVRPKAEVQVKVKPPPDKPQAPLTRLLSSLGQNKKAALGE
jgi:RND family efflux transporter MFP subunit